ncbi:MAG: YHS domain-containing (seleno)protein [Myxococcota bacterium]
MSGRPVLAAIAAVLALTLASPARALDPIYTNWRGLALSGYDPVAYFKVGAPVAGFSEFEFEWQGATWRFANAENLALFRADPERYAPQYGGYCAWAVSNGDTASSDPEAWKIVGGKLYLNYSRAIQERWQGDVPGNIRRADASWPHLRGSR